MILRSPTENENEDFVMPAWIAGIQVRKDAPETSMSIWIPALHAGMTRFEGHLLEMNEVTSAPDFKIMNFNFVPFVMNK